MCFSGCWHDFLLYIVQVGKGGGSVWGLYFLRAEAGMMCTKEGRHTEWRSDMTLVGLQCNGLSCRNGTRFHHDITGYLQQHQRHQAQSLLQCRTAGRRPRTPHHGALPAQPPSSKPDSQKGNILRCATLMGEYSTNPLIPPRLRQKRSVLLHIRLLCVQHRLAHQQLLVVHVEDDVGSLQEGRA